MVTSRLKRFEKRKEQKRIVWAIGGSILLIIFVLFFGLKILIGFSVFVDRLRGNTPVSTSKTNPLIFPPTLDPVVEATNSATITISGRGAPGLTIILYINDSEKKSTVSEDGTFSIPDVQLKDGPNTISSKLKDDKDPTSELSNVLTIIYKKSEPILEVTSPNDNSSITGEKNTISVDGKVEEGTSITVNGRLVIVSGNNTFHYDYPLTSGDNTLTIVATDDAGNTKTVTRRVSYQR